MAQESGACRCFGIRRNNMSLKFCMQNAATRPNKMLTVKKRATKNVSVSTYFLMFLSVKIVFGRWSTVNPARTCLGSCTGTHQRPWRWGWAANDPTLIPVSNWQITVTVNILYISQLSRMKYGFQSHGHN